MIAMMIQVQTLAFDRDGHKARFLTLSLCRHWLQPGHGAVQVGFNLGETLNATPDAAAHLAAACEAHRADSFVACSLGEHGERAGLLLRVGAGTEDVLRGYLNATMLLHKGPGVIKGAVQEAREAAAAEGDAFLVALGESGWQVDRVLLDFGVGGELSPAQSLR